MALPTRGRIVLPGAVFIGIVSLLLTWLSVSSFANNPRLLDVLWFGAAVVAAPLFFLWEHTFGQRLVPESTLSFAIAALVATPLHAILPRRWSGAISIAGLACWLLCALIVAGAPA